jgi:glyoxylase-like metal-dependent hydrolase (beta-lactamase superfamily II)
MHTQVSTITDQQKDSKHYVAPGVYRQQTVMVNTYLVGQPDNSWVLIDAGIGGWANRIRRTAETLFGPGAKPAAIILTHGHFDHIGSLQDILQFWNVPVYAHTLELPYLTGRSHYPPPDPSVGGGVMTFMSRFFPNSPIDITGKVSALPEDHSVPGLPDWRWIHTPGHTDGHISLFRESDRTLIAGDAFVTVNQESSLSLIMQPKKVRRPPAYFTTNWQAAQRSVEQLAGLQPEIAATGHGLPMQGEELREELQALATDFYNQQVPVHGRYGLRPARANENGVVFVPPPVSDPLPGILVGIGLAAVVGAAFISFLRRRRETELDHEKSFHLANRYYSPQVD